MINNHTKSTILNRLNIFKKKINELNIDFVLISKMESKLYFSDFKSSAYYLVITKDKNYLLTDFRYYEQANDYLSNVFDVVLITPKYTIYNFLSDFNKHSLGIEKNNLTAAEYDQLLKILKLDYIQSIDNLISELRMIKDPYEIENIAKAAEIADAALTHGLSFIKEGISEKDIALELEFFMKKNGADALSFDTIVASGERSSLPHGVPTDKKIVPGDFITIDLGCKVNNYCSDMTRTYVLGKASDEQKKIYDIVLKAQILALSAIKPGLKCDEVDYIAREYIAKQDYGKFFGHGLGHSVGLEIHEKPNLSIVDHTILKKDMVLTIEPGIYIPHFGGVRIEDLVVLTYNGCRILSKSQKKLIEI